MNVPEVRRMGIEDRRIYIYFGQAIAAVILVLGIFVERSKRALHVVVLGAGLDLAVNLNFRIVGLKLRRENTPEWGGIRHYP